MALPSRDVERLVRKLCGCLRGNVRLDPQRSRNSSSCDEFPWFSIRFDDERARSSVDGARWHSVRDKLEAVSVLSAVASCRAFSLQRNPRFWVTFLERDCDVRSSELLTRYLCSDRVHADAMPMFLLDFSFIDITPDELRLCRAFLAAKRRAKRCLRMRFTTAMAQLEAIALASHCTQPKTVRIGFVFKWCDLQAPHDKSANATDQSNAVQHLQELVRAVSTRATALATLRFTPHANVLDVDPTVWRCVVFEVASLEVGTSALVKRDFVRLAHVISDPSSRLRALVLNNVVTHASGRDCATAIGTLLTECFATRTDTDALPAPVEPSPNKLPVATSEALAVNKRVVLERLVFDWNALSLISLSSLFSAVASSRPTESSVRELSLVGSFRRFDGDATLPWAWLAFGVFHAASTSRIRALDLSSNTLTLDDVFAMKRVLTMDAFERELLGLHVTYSEKNRVQAASATRHVRAARLKRQATLVQTREGDCNGVKLQLNDERVWLDVFAHDSQWTCVLVPGYGTLWTRSKDVLALETRERAVGTKPSSIQSLMLHAMVRKETEPMSRVMRELLPIVGASLVHLELSSNPLTNATLATIMTACPLLTHLDVTDCELATIAAIVDAYERGTCRLTSLIAAENEIRSPDVRRLCFLMRAPSSSTAATSDGSDSSRMNSSADARAQATATKLRWLDLDQNPIGRQGLLAVGKMLQVNRVLETIVLSRSEDPDGQLRSRFAIYDDEFLHVQSFKMQQQLALLSIAHVLPALTAVDEPVLSAIFAFAATHVIRRVVWK